MKSVSTVVLDNSFANYIICNGGAVIYDVENSKYIKEEIIDAEEIAKVIKSSENYEGLYYNLFNTENWYSNKLKEKHIINKTLEEVHLENEKINHISIHFSSKEKTSNFYDFIKDNEKVEKVLMQSSEGNLNWIEILPRGINKFKSINEVAKLNNIENKNTIAIGDSPNDLEMIKNCGIGVAMGNAEESIKNVAKYITKSNNEKGVEIFLRKHFE